MMVSRYLSSRSASLGVEANPSPSCDRIDQHKHQSEHARRISNQKYFPCWPAPTTFFPTMAFWNSAPLVPAFPNTLESSTALTDLIVLPTRLFRRWWTTRATVFQKSVKRSVRHTDQGFFLAFCDFRHLESCVDPKIQRWSSEQASCVHGFLRRATARV